MKKESIKYTHPVHSYQLHSLESQNRQLHTTYPPCHVRCGPACMVPVHIIRLATLSAMCVCARQNAVCRPCPTRNLERIQINYLNRQYHLSLFARYISNATPRPCSLSLSLSLSTSQPRPSARHTHRASERLLSSDKHARER
jgi:hypothetical protein